MNMMTKFAKNAALAVGLLATGTGCAGRITSVNYSREVCFDQASQSEYFCTIARQKTTTFGPDRPTTTTRSEYEVVPAPVFVAPPPAVCVDPYTHRTYYCAPGGYHPY